MAKKVWIGMLAMAMAMVFGMAVVSCGGNDSVDSAALVGTWSMSFFGEQRIMELNANGSFTMEEGYVTGTWSTSGNTLTMRYDNIDMTFSMSFALSNNGNTLTLRSGGGTETWTRVN